MNTDGWGFVPEKFDPARERPETQDRDSGQAATLNRLMRDMDDVVMRWERGDFDPALEHGAADTMAAGWRAIREVMGL